MVKLLYMGHVFLICFQTKQNQLFVKKIQLGSPKILREFRHVNFRLPRSNRREERFAFEYLPNVKCEYIPLTLNVGKFSRLHALCQMAQSKS